MEIAQTADLPALEVGHRIAPGLGTWVEPQADVCIDPVAVCEAIPESVTAGPLASSTLSQVFEEMVEPMANLPSAVTCAAGEGSVATDRAASPGRGMST